jgi:hypothetical protein
MKKTLLLCTTLLLTASLNAADSSPKDEIIAAAGKLADQASYSWRTTVVVPEGSQFRPGPTEGKTEKDGLTQLKLSFGDNTTEAFFKGGNAAVTNPEGGWQSLSELESSGGPARFLGGILRNFKSPPVQAGEIAVTTKELKKDGDVYSSDLSEDGAKTLLTFRGRRAGGEAPAISDAKGSAKFWIKDGVLSKFEFKVTGKVSFGGNELNVDRTTTVEIKDIGATKIEPPEGAKKKLFPEAAPAPAPEKK